MFLVRCLELKTGQYQVTTVAIGGHLVRRQLEPTPLSVMNGFGIFEGGHPHVHV